MNFEANEDFNATRFAWNVFPASKAEASKLVVPIGSLYTPLKVIDGLRTANYDPIFCSKPNCKAIINPYCSLDMRANIWLCPFCQSRNQLPVHYSQITQDNVPLELQQESSTMEYILTKPVQQPPIFLFVIDLCQDEDNLQALKETLIISLNLLPPNSLIGLITYGTVVNLHDLNSPIAKSMVFRGDKDYSMDLLTNLLNKNFTQFFGILQNVEFQLTSILENLKPDQWAVKSGNRSLRSTGSAISIATSLLQGAYPSFGARIQLFSAGPGTLGPGMIVSNELKEPIRSHSDIDKDSVKHYKKAIKFYEQLASRGAKNGHTFDIFAGCYDQIGMNEMQSLANKTGGVLLLCDAFTTSIFKQSYLRLFSKDNEGYLLMGFNAHFEVKTSKELKLQGLIGHAIPIKDNNNNPTNVSDTEIGLGGTNTWKMRDRKSVV